MNFNAKYTPQPDPFFPLNLFQKLSVLFSPRVCYFFHVCWSLNVYILPGGMNEAFYSRAFEFSKLKTDAFRVRVYVCLYVCVILVGKCTFAREGCARTCPPLALSACLVAAQNFT